MKVEVIIKIEPNDNANDLLKVLDDLGSVETEFDLQILGWIKI